MKNKDNWNANTHYQNKKIANDYDDSRFSSIAGKVFNILEKKTIIKGFHSLQSGAKIADMPCGTGRLAKTLLEHKYCVHGMDISDDMLEIARSRLNKFGNKLTTEVANAKELNQEHEQYDGVLCARVLMHFELDEQIAFLKGVSQITCGPILINHSYSTPYLRLRRKFKKLLGHQPSSRFPITDIEIKQLLKKSNLKEVNRFRLNSVISEAIYILALPIEALPIEA